MLHDALVGTRKKTLARKPIFYLASGEALELWMLKVACGHYFGIGAKDGVRLDRNYAINLAKIEKAFFQREWDPRCGLYLKGGVGRRITTENKVKVSAILEEPQMRMVGVTTGLLGFELELLIDSENANPGPWAGFVMNPTELVLRGRFRPHSIILTWPPGYPQRSVTMNEVPAWRRPLTLPSLPALF